MSERKLLVGLTSFLAAGAMYSDHLHSKNIGEDEKNAREVAAYVVDNGHRIIPSRITQHFQDNQGVHKATVDVGVSPRDYSVDSLTLVADGCITFMGMDPYQIINSTPDPTYQANVPDGCDIVGKRNARNRLADLVQHF